MNSQYISVLNIPDIIFMYSYGMYIMHMNLCVTIIIYNYLRILTVTCFIFFQNLMDQCPYHIAPVAHINDHASQLITYSLIDIYFDQII